MPTRDERAREIQDSIRQIFLHDWDPIGVGDGSVPPDEYDSYIGGVYRLLASGASAEAVAEHLAKVEKDWLGVPSAPPDHLLRVARRLCLLDVRLGATNESA
jgi:hypothetical protein